MNVKAGSEVRLTLQRSEAGEDASRLIASAASELASRRRRDKRCGTGPLLDLTGYSTGSSKDCTGHINVTKSVTTRVTPSVTGRSPPGSNP